VRYNKKVFVKKYWNSRTYSNDVKERGKLTNALCKYGAGWVGFQHDFTGKKA